MNAFRIYAIPEGYVAVSRAFPLVFSPAFDTERECQQWCDSREVTT